MKETHFPPIFTLLWCLTLLLFFRGIPARPKVQINLGRYANKVLPAFSFHYVFVIKSRLSVSLIPFKTSNNMKKIQLYMIRTYHRKFYTHSCYLFLEPNPEKYRKVQNKLGYLCTTADWFETLSLCLPVNNTLKFIRIFAVQPVK